ncbi:DUF3080 family protein [Alteromonas sp. H39]|uniref:DUF3080 family protein n=1 Tax=Alteromonas sp. H39 TaxID=3389876 RepID=UPI0039E0B17C
MPVRDVVSTGVALALLLLGGCCQVEVPDALDEYQARLERVLDINLGSLPSPAPLNFPSRESLHVDVPPMNINLREFYALQECEIGTLVAERNTALGRTPHPSQRFRYETRLINAMDACVTLLKDKKPELSAKLAEWKHEKLVQRNTVWANLITTSEAMRLAMTISRGWIRHDTNPDAGAAVNAIGYLNKLKTTLSLSMTELDEQLKQIESSRLPARLWVTQDYLQITLTELTNALAQPLAAINCPDGRATDEAKILRNVFYLFFIEQIQPVGSNINQYYYQIQPVFTQWQTDPSLSEPFKAFLRERETKFGAYQKAISEHVTLWQGFLKRCNLSPTAPSAS